MVAIPVNRRKQKNVQWMLVFHKPAGTSQWTQRFVCWRVVGGFIASRDLTAAAHVEDATLLFNRARIAMYPACRNPVTIPIKWPQWSSRCDSFLFPSPSIDIALPQSSNNARSRNGHARVDSNAKRVLRWRHIPEKPTPNRNWQCRLCFRVDCVLRPCHGPKPLK